MIDIDVTAERVASLLVTVKRLKSKTKRLQNQRDQARFDLAVMSSRMAVIEQSTTSAAIIPKDPGLQSQVASEITQ